MTNMKLTADSTVSVSLLGLISAVIFHKLLNLDIKPKLGMVKY